MENKIDIHQFENKLEAVKSLGDKVIFQLKDAITKNGQANILLSGGSTPAPLYSYINSIYDQFEVTHFGLIDERFVPKEDVNSNELLIKKHLKKLVHFTGLVHNDSDYSDNLSKARRANERYLLNTDISILGMGGDGHFASLFPEDPSSLEALNHQDANIYNTRAPKEPMQRITFSKQAILNSTHIYLLLFGKEKLDVLKDSEQNLPIHNLLKSNKKIDIYYAEN